MTSVMSVTALTPAPSSLSSLSLSSGFLNTFPGSDTISTLSTSQTAVPTLHRPLGCGSGIQTPPTNQPVCALLSNDQTAQLLLECCNGAPRVVYASNCNVYCQARNQTLENLRDCLVRDTRNRDPGPFLCNRIGDEYSSLLPAETDPAIFTQSLLPTTSTGGNTSPTVSQVSTAAAGLSYGAPYNRKDGEFLTFAAWSTIAVLAMSGFAGMMM